MYIVFEGIDGSGKSTQCQMLGQALNKLGYTPIYVQEPSYGETGRRVRRIISAEDDPEASRLHDLFTTDRKEHVRDKIIPSLELIDANPSFVLLQSRGYLSAPAYQGAESQDLLSILREQQSIAPRPDMFLYIDVDEGTAIERIRDRNEDRVTFDTEHKLREIRRRYLAIIGEESENILKFDGNQQQEVLHTSILDLVLSELQV